MFKTIKILYRELHFQMIKRNPRIAEDEQKLKDALKRYTSITRTLLLQSFSFMIFGFFLAVTVYMADIKSVIPPILTSIAFIPFILSIYQTAVQSSYIVSLNIFKPLETIPTKLGALYLSGLLVIDLIPGLIIALPTVIVLIYRFPLTGVLSFIWIAIGSLFGHTIGIIIFSQFGLKISHKRGRYNTVKNIFRIIALMLFMGIFFFITYFQEYIIAQSSVIQRFSYVYPFSIATVFDHLETTLLLFIHLAVIIPVYYVYIRKTWANILEPPIISEREEEPNRFKGSTKKPVLSLLFKDLKIMSRKTAMLAGFLFPLYIVLPQILIAINQGDMNLFRCTILVFMAALLSIWGSDAILKIEGKSVDFLKTLPIKKSKYALSKSISMSLVPTLLTLTIVGIGFYFDDSVILLIPHALLLPIIASFGAMAYLFSYESKEVGIPETDYKKMIMMFLIVGVVFGGIAIPLFLLNGTLRYVVSDLIILIIICVLYFRYLK